MKVIDLINMRYKGEKMPKTVIINRMRYEYDELQGYYRDENGEMQVIDASRSVLSLPVEIIADAIDIQGIKEVRFSGDGKVDYQYVIPTINTLIEAVKQLDRKIKGD